MGDRRQTVLHYPAQGDKPESLIYVYTHWSGSEMPKTVQDALKRGEDRWDDTPYLARIIVSECFKVDGIDSTTGAGLAPYDMESEYDDVHIYLNEGPSSHIAIGDETWSFAEYIAAGVDSFGNIVPAQKEG